MKKKKLIATVLSASMLVGLLAGCGSSTDPAESPTGGGETTPAQGETTPAQNDVDYANFVIDPAQIPQEKLDTTLYLAVSVRGLENPYIATINEGMKLFAEYLDSIGQKYEMQVLDSQGDSAKEVDNMRQFAAKANGNAIAYADPNEDTIAYSLAEAMAESGGYLGTAWNKPADVGPSDLDPNWVIHTSPDNVVNGYNIAKALFDSMGGEGQIFVVQGLLGNTASNARYEGLQKALEEYPNIEVVADDTANWNTDEALALVETWLTQYPDVGGIWCANDNMATGALQALDAAGLKGKVGVCGIDANTDIVEAIANGEATATVSSNGYLQGGKPPHHRRIHLGRRQALGVRGGAKVGKHGGVRPGRCLCGQLPACAGQCLPLRVLSRRHAGQAEGIRLDGIGSRRQIGAVDRPDALRVQPVCLLTFPAGGSFIIGAHAAVEQQRAFFQQRAYIAHGGGSPFPTKALGFQFNAERASGQGFSAPAACRNAVFVLSYAYFME